MIIHTRRFAPRAVYAARYARSGRKSTSNYALRSGQRSTIEYSFCFMIVVTKWQLDNAKSPAPMLQEKTARTPHTLLRVVGGSARYSRSHAVRTYIPPVGYLFSSDTLYVRKRKHSTARQQHRKNNENETEKFGKKKKSPSPLM